MRTSPLPHPLDVYVDGSFRERRVFYGFLVVDRQACKYKERGELKGAVKKMNQIGGELQAVVKAVKWAKLREQPVRICYDYVGIECWVGDLFGKKAWKTSNPFTTKYRHFMLANQEWVAGMKWIRGHSGNFWNSKVDAFVGGGAVDF